MPNIRRGNSPLTVSLPHSQKPGWQQTPAKTRRKINITVNIQKPEKRKEHHHAFGLLAI